MSERERRIKSMREGEQRMDRAAEFHYNEIIVAIRAGVHVPADRLAWLVRRDRLLPGDVRWYIGDRLEGRIKPKGRPKKIPMAPHNVYDRNLGTGPDAAFWAGQHEMLKEEYRKERAAMGRLKREQRPEYDALRKRLKRPRATPEQLAYAVIAERDGETYDVVRNAVKRASKSRQ